MEFFKKNQFKMAAISLSILIVFIVIIFVSQKENQNNTNNNNKLYYTVKFEGVEEGNISNQIVIKGGKINEPKDPKKEGYIFLGWYIDDEKYNFDELINKDIKLEAKWKKDGEEEIIEEPSKEDKTNDDKPTTENTDNKKPTTNNNNNNSNNSNNNNNDNTNSGSSNNNKPTTSDKINVTGITLNKTNITLEIGNSDTLTATVNPSNATNKNVTWTSSNKNVATVNNGVVQAVGAGSATITATADGKSVNCTITVNKKITYNYEWQRIESSSIGEYYLYIISSEGQKVSGKVNIVYANGKSKEHDVPATGVKIVKSTVTSVSIISTN